MKILMWNYKGTAKTSFLLTILSFYFISLSLIYVPLLKLVCQWIHYIMFGICLARHGTYIWSLHKGDLEVLQLFGVRSRFSVDFACRQIALHWCYLFSWNPFLVILGITYASTHGKERRILWNAATQVLSLAQAIVILVISIIYFILMIRCGIGLSTRSRC